MSLDTARSQAILWALAGALFYTLIFASARFIGPEANPIQIVFMNYFVAALIMVVIAAFTLRGTGALKTRLPGLHAARTLSSVFGDLCIISAPLFIAYEDSTAISLTDGVITMLLAVALLKERASPLHWLAAMLCLLGAMVIARADAGTGVGSSAIGLGLAAFGAVFSGSEMLFIKMLSDRDKPILIMLIVNVLGSLMLLGPAIWVWQPFNGSDYLVLLLIGPLALAEEYCWIKALQNAAAVAVVPIGYASIPFAAALGVLVFHQNLGLQEISGALLVIAGGIVLSRLTEKDEE